MSGRNVLTVTYIGDANGEGPDRTFLFGFTFPKSETVEVSLSAGEAAKLKANRHFIVDGEIPAKATITGEAAQSRTLSDKEALQAECDARGISYDRRWGEKRLRKLLEADDGDQRGSA